MINQGIEENKIFIKDQIYKIVKGSENNNHLKDIIFKYNLLISNNECLKEKINNLLNEDENKIIEILKNIKKKIDEKNIKKDINFKYFYLDKTLKNIENKEDVEITDWIQMELYWNIINNNSLKYNIKGLMFDTTDGYIKFKEDSKQEKIVYVENVYYQDLFHAF